MGLRSTYAARWQSFNLRDVLGECEAGEERGGENEELHDVCFSEDSIGICVDALSDVTIESFAG